MKQFKKLTRLLSGAILGIAIALPLPGQPEAGRYLHESDFDVTEMIPASPAMNSLTAKTDLETVYMLQQRRGPEQIALARYFVQDNVFQYDEVIGTWFTAANLPLTAEFFAQIEADRYAISSQGKRAWNRPRPPLVDSRIQPCVSLPKSGAYPSGHSTQAFVWAGLLAEIFPDKREALRERAQLVAWSRVIGGVHYPTDIMAGRALGDQLVAAFLKVPELREVLQTVKGEIARVSAVEHIDAIP